MTSLENEHLPQDSWTRVQDVFSRCIDLRGEERDARARQLCGDDSSLLEEVRSLLERSDHSAPGLDGEALWSLALLGTGKSSIATGARIGRYRLDEAIAEGGMGVVYRAEQLEPVRRSVAFKVIRTGLRGEEILRRFERERQSLARLDHDNIARFLDAGATDDGAPYFVMDYVVGESLVRACDAYRLDVPARLRLFQRICDGVHHAHQRGLIHRDLKPANILVTGSATSLTPKIIDFGIARALENDVDSTESALTLAGSFLGTPAYMSPEQLEGSIDLDVRTDVYALGVILHELLTGELPFDVQSSENGGLRAFQERVRLVEPKRPSDRISTATRGETSFATTHSTTAAALARTLRGDLDWIILKSLAKERDLRYASALDLSHDIERYLQHEPVIAGPPTTWYRVRKFITRHRTLVSAIALVAVSLIAATIISLNASIESKRSERAARAATAREQRQSYLANVAAAAYALERGNRDDALLRLDGCFEPLRGFECRHLQARIQENDLAMLTSHRFGAMVMAVAILPGTTRVLAGSNDGTIRCFDTLTGEESWRTEAVASPPAAQMPFDGVLSLASSPDATTFAAGHFSGRVVLRDAATGLERHVVECGARVFATAFSSDGSEFLAAAAGVNARGRADLVRHRVDDGSLVETLDRRNPQVFAILCADSLRIEGTPKGVRVFDGDELVSDTPTDHYISRLAFDPGSKRILAAGAGTRRAYLIDLGTNSAVTSLQSDAAAITAVTFGPEPGQAMTGDGQGRLQVWDLASQSVRRTVLAHSGAIHGVAYDPIHRRVVTTGADHEARVIDLDQRRAWERQRVLPFTVDRIALAPDGRDVLLMSRGLLARVPLRLGESATSHLPFEPWEPGVPNTPSAGQWALDVAWHPHDVGRMAIALLPHPPQAHPKSGRLLLWKKDGDERRVIETGEQLWAIRVTPDGKRVIGLGIFGTLVVVDWESGAIVATRPHEQELGGQTLRLDPSGRRVLVVRDQSEFEITDLETGSLLARYTGEPLRTFDAIWSNDGERLYSAEGDAILIRDAASGAILERYLGHRGSVRALALAPDGTRLASAGADRTVRLWDLADGANTLVLRDLTGDLSALAYSVDGSTLFAGDSRGEIGMWREAVLDE